MKTYTPDLIHNIALISHQSAGKTTILEAIAYNLKYIDRMGNVSQGNTLSDFDQDEIERQFSIFTSLIPVEFKGHKINFLDTPGFLDFSAEVLSGLKASEMALLVVSAQGKVEVGTEIVWDLSEKEGLPVAFLVNRLDKEHTDFYAVLNDISDKLTDKVVPMQLPIGKELDFKGIADVITLKSYEYTQRGEYKEIQTPEDLKDKLLEYKTKIAEAVAETDDELFEKYLENDGLDDEDIVKGLKNAILQRKFYPLYISSAVNNVGLTHLLESIVNSFPTALDRKEIKLIDKKTKEEKVIKVDITEPISSFVFKTATDPYVGRLNYVKVLSGKIDLSKNNQLYNSNKEQVEKVTNMLQVRGKQQNNITIANAGDIVVLTKLQNTYTGDTLVDKELSNYIYPEIKFSNPVYPIAIKPKTKTDEDKLSNALNRLKEENPGFKVVRDADLKQTVIYGMGDLQLQILLNRIKRRFNVSVDIEPVKIPYRETITKKKIEVEGKYKKQTGGRGQYGHVWLRIEPKKRGEGFEFVNQIVGGVVPRNYIPAVEKGVISAMKSGYLAGYPVVDLKVTIYDGSYHPVDSSDLAFQIAGSMALKKALEQGNSILLEPIVNMEINVPDSFMGDIMGDINGKRGKILGMDALPKKRQLIKAQVPLAEVVRYAIDLRSITQGRGWYSMEFSHYEVVPPQIAENIIAEAKKEKEEAKT